MNNDIKKRFYSLLWRAGMMALAVIVDGLIKMLTQVNLPQVYVVLGGLALGEISKYINNISLKEE